MNVREVYLQRGQGYADDEARAEQLSLRLSRSRGMTFFVAVGLFFHGWFSGQGGIWYLLGAIVSVGFLALITWHEQVIRRLARLQIRRQMNDHGIARLDRNWHQLPDFMFEVPSDFHAVSGDIDLFGRNSLSQLIGLPQTPAGIRTLGEWLVRPAAPESISDRQRAVRELGPRIDTREALLLEGRLLDERGQSVEHFVKWAESDPWLARRPWIAWPSRVLPFVILGGALLVFTEQISVELGFYLLSAALLLNIALLVLFAGKVHDLFKQIHRGGDQIRRYATMFDLMVSMPDAASELASIKQQVTIEGGGVQSAMRQLQRITALANIQHSALFFVFVYMPLQFGLLFDFHVLTLYEIWQRRYGSLVRNWFLALGKFEALAALATLHFEQPDWTFPVVDAQLDRITAEGLGHPLLSDAIRVTNDVTVGPKGSVLLVTGSNMSGKSTLLRALGVNAVLAQAGAPVSARRFELPPVELATSIRIRDSLAAGVSFYMAELLRLKQIVEQARRVETEPPKMLLYLLDEILLGTNSRERHLAVVAVLDFLLHHRAMGAITTHDLELATSPSLVSVCQCIHFRESIRASGSEPAITFDYRLRPGVATTTNALELLKLVGLSRP